MTESTTELNRAHSQRASLLAGGDPSRLRRLNTLTAIFALRDNGDCTISDLVRLTGLSRPAMENVLRDVVEQGWAELVGSTALAMGRPARQYRFRAAARHVLGLDIGAHAVRGAIADLDGTLLAQSSVRVSPETRASKRLACVDEVLASCLTEAGLRADNLSAAGVATTGLVDSAGRVILATGIPDWAGIDLVSALSEKLCCSINAENDTKMAALAEQWRGAARGARDVVYVLAGRRTAASLIVGGQLHRGLSGAAGEIGMLPEAQWAAAQEQLLRYPTSAELSPDEQARQVFDDARAGTPAAKKAVRGYVRRLAVGIAALVLVLDPERVVVGGGYSRAGEVLLSPLRRELERRCLRTPTVVPSELGSDAPMLGAVRRALDTVEAEAFAE